MKRLWCIPVATILTALVFSGCDYMWIARDGGDSEDTSLVTSEAWAIEFPNAGRRCLEQHNIFFEELGKTLKSIHKVIRCFVFLLHISP